MLRRTASRRSPSPARLRPLFRIGPGLVLAALLSLYLVSRWMMNEQAAREQAALPPVVHRPVATAEGEELGPIPQVRLILDREEALQLTDAQVARLGLLDQEWTRFSHPRELRANAAAKAAGSYLERAKDNRRTPVAHIEDEAREVIALSGELATARRTLWHRALAELTAEQRAIVKRERRANWAESKRRRPAQEHDQ